MRLLDASLLALALVACAPSETPSGGTDAGTPPAARHEYVAVSGEVKFHPLELEWRAAASQGTPPSLQGLTVRVENSTDALLKRPPLASDTLAADGKFSFAQVDVVNVSLALVGSVKDPAATPNVMESGYGLHRYEPGDPRPAEFKDKPVYVISTAFEKKLADALGMDTAGLEADGFVLGRVVDAEGKGVEGAQVGRVGLSGIEPITNGEDEHLIDYLNDDLSGTITGGKTGPSGAFVLFPGASTKEYSAIKAGATFTSHLSGARQGTALTLFLEKQ